MDQRRVAASDVISAICTELGYSRAHVASLLRKNSQVLKAKRNRAGRWFLPQESALTLHNLVLASGPRYKLGEKLRGART